MFSINWSIKQLISKSLEICVLVEDASGSSSKTVENNGNRRFRSSEILNKGWDIKKKKLTGQ